MRRLVTRDADVIRLAVQDEIQQSKEARYDHRLHGVLMLCNGMSCYEVAQVLGYSPRTVEGWVKCFEADELAGLREQVRLGRPSLLDEAVVANVGRDLRKPPGSLGYKQELRNGKRLSHHLQVRYGVALGVR